MSTAERLRAWLFDLYPAGREMILWFIAEDGRRLRVPDATFEFLTFLEGPPPEVEACIREVSRSGDAEDAGYRERRDFWTGEPRRVRALRVGDLRSWRRRLAHWHARFPGVAWHNADLAAEQVYGYERHVFPLALCEVELGEGGGLRSLRTLEERWATEYEAPPLRTAWLKVEGSLLGRRPWIASVTLEAEGEERTWDEPEYLLPSFQEALDRLDPDVLLTRGGDASGLPLLLTMARERRFPLRLDRERPPEARRLETEGRSFMSYGRILYSAPEYPLYGRWHLDLDNSFMGNQAGLEGIFEVTRLSRMPAQRIGRRSIGTGITSVQLDMAYADGYLVPWKKTHPEAWKSAEQLLQTDRGGLVYAPRPGMYENVVELDFVSMYPTIMSRFNVSPETVNCACCRNGAVPEIGYTICGKRHGLVSRALAPVIEKRIEYKRLRADARARGDGEAARRWDHRQCALKWMLVCCFGYLGYRNARFGRIEAHEAVSAFSRELLLRAREVCEEAGWEVIHANVDCVYIRKPGFRREELGPLIERIDAATGLDIALEGIYRWVAFLPSTQVADRPVPTRYFGAFEDGSLKYRGIECRRSDLPSFVKDAQLALLQDFAHARNAEQYNARAHLALRRIASWEKALRRHEVPLEELAIRASMSREPGEYRGNGRQALAARQSAEAGLDLHAGQTLEYYLTAGRNADPTRRVRLRQLRDADTSYDPEPYVELLRRAVNTLLWPAGLEAGKAAPNEDQQLELAL